MVHQYKLWMVSQTVLIHSTLFYTQKCLKVNLMFKCCWGIFSQNNSNDRKEVHKRITWTDFTAYSLSDFTITVRFVVWKQQNKATFHVGFGWMCRTWQPSAALGKIIWQVLKLVHGQIWGAAAHCVIACWFKMAALSGGAVCYLMIRSMHLHKWALQTGGLKPQNLIFTGCSHKAIGKHAGLSTAPLHQEFQQQVVKAKVSVILIQQHQIRNIRYWPRWERRKTICQQCGEYRSCERRARTGTATTEENHFGSSCCFMAEY